MHPTVQARTQGGFERTPLLALQNLHTSHNKAYLLARYLVTILPGRDGVLVQLYCILDILKAVVKVCFVRD